jgi:hypothetical protein
MRFIKHIATARVRAIAAFALTLVAALGISVAPAFAGPVGWQASGGWYTQDGDFFAGAGARFGLGTITLIPNAEWLFVDSGSAYSLNVDGTLSVLPLGVANGYIGAGLGLLVSNPEHGDSNTDSVLNLIAGAGLNAVPLKPFAQFKWVVTDGDDPRVFSIGVRF